jgi:hypothetical protein
MMGVRAQPHAIGERIQPIEKEGLRIMSMGFLNPGDKPLVWRGPMLHSVIQQFLRSVDWGELDYLIVDLPPGTGDVQLSLIQTAPLTGAVVVTTPSEVSLEDARKAIHMFEQVRVPILGLVENMSYLQCPHCSERIDVFSHGGGKKTAETMNVPFLGELPLDPAVRVHGSIGEFFGYENRVAVGCTARRHADIPSGRDNAVECAAIHHQVLDHGKCPGSPRLDIQLLAVLEMPHAELANGCGGQRSMRDSVDHESARSATSLAAIVLECDRIFALTN